MPRKNLYTREQIVDAALALTSEGGPSALTARALGQRLGTTAKPIFSQFESMEQVQLAVRQEAQRLYERRLEEAMTAGKYPPYKASGMAYVRFALEERELFRLLFIHGIATALATGYLPWDEEQVSRMMSDVYFGLRHRFCQPEQP